MIELDKRIKTLASIITCFDEDKDRARECVGQMGYFSDDMMEFSDLENCIYGKLEDYSINEDYPFRCSSDGIDHAFFIPGSALNLKPKEKKLRPHTIAEFCHQFPIGTTITFRAKDYKELVHTVMFIGYRVNDEGLTLLLGNAGFSLEELFEEHEWAKSADSNDFQPFGVEE